MRARAYAPGRTELAGNHTDHQGGRVVAAALDCGVAVEVETVAGSRACVDSLGFPPADIDVFRDAPVEEERFTTAALVRGVVAGLRRAGCPVGGFRAHVESTVPPGSGLSSSAAFEVALARALCRLGGVELAPVALARIGQAAERDYFGKECGLMDQLAVALGGIAAIDFAGDEPRVEPIGFDFGCAGFTMCLVDTHVDHSAYTNEYTQVPRDMAAVAGIFGKDMLSQVSQAAFLARLGEVRSALGDVPALRALHYYHEMSLVDARVNALRAGDVKAFLDFTRQSGASSAQYLQNVSTYDRASQPAMVALALADLLLEGEGACRIHGGGFGGTVQAFVPDDRVASFTQAIDAQLGEGSCRAYRIASPSETLNGSR